MIVYDFTKYTNVIVKIINGQYMIYKNNLADGPYDKIMYVLEKIKDHRYG